jgi:hypothetical protein
MDTLCSIVLVFALIGFCAYPSSVLAELISLRESGTTLPRNIVVKNVVRIRADVQANHTGSSVF